MKILSVLFPKDVIEISLGRSAKLRLPGMYLLQMDPFVVQGHYFRIAHHL